jgi:hypothetical protein
VPRFEPNQKIKLRFSIRRRPVGNRRKRPGNLDRAGELNEEIKGGLYRSAILPVIDREP